MRLKEIFEYLRQDGLEEPLKLWFRRSFKTMEGKISSLHYAIELDMEGGSVKYFV